MAETLDQEILRIANKKWFKESGGYHHLTPRGRSQKFKPAATIKEIKEYPCHYSVLLDAGTRGYPHIIVYKKELA